MDKIRRNALKAASAAAVAGVLIWNGSNAGASPEKAHGLAEGQHGQSIKTLQQRLNALHYYAGPVDGQFGGDTQEAVWAFQEAQGLTADGIAGKTTERYLARPRQIVPKYPGGGTHVEVDLAKRVLVLYSGNQAVLISHVSPAGGYRYCDKSGCQTAATPMGSFRTTEYMPGWVKVPLGKMYNPVFFSGTEFAIHGDTDVPLGPASHGCIRVPMDVARIFHTEVTTPGTPVFVYK